MNDLYVNIYKNELIKVIILAFKVGKMSLLIFLIKYLNYIQI